MYQQEKDLREFSSYVVSEYEADSNDVTIMVEREYERLLDFSKERRSKRLKEYTHAHALGNCRAWLNEERNEIKPEHLVSTCVSRLFFVSLQKKEARA